MTAAGDTGYISSLTEFASEHSIALASSIVGVSVAGAAVVARRASLNRGLATHGPQSLAAGAAAGSSANNAGLLLQQATTNSKQTLNQVKINRSKLHNEIADKDQQIADTKTQLTVLNKQRAAVDAKTADPSMGPAKKKQDAAGKNLRALAQKSGELVKKIESGIRNTATLIKESGSKIDQQRAIVAGEIRTSKDAITKASKDKDAAAIKVESILLGSVTTDSGIVVNCSDNVISPIISPSTSKAKGQPSNLCGCWGKPKTHSNEEMSPLSPAPWSGSFPDPPFTVLKDETETSAPSSPAKPEKALKP